MRDARTETAHGSGEGQGKKAFFPDGGGPAQGPGGPCEPPDRAEPPRWLGKKFHAEFREIGEILRQAGLYTELDRDVLGQFLVARERWLRSDRLASAAIRARDEKLAKEWTAVQSSYFRQCRQCAEVMGLSISSRCRLVVPEVLANAAKDEGEEDEFTRALKARQARAAGG